MVKNPIGITNMSVGFCNFATLTCQQWKISSNAAFIILNIMIYSIFKKLVCGKILKTVINDKSLW